MTCIAFGSVVGLVTSTAAKAIRIRPAVMMLAAVAASIGLYSAWAADAVTVLGGDALGVSYRPDFLYRYVAWLYDRGSFVFRDNVVRGPRLTFVWGAEAILIVGSAVGVARVTSRPSRRVCPSCNGWLLEKFGAARLSLSGTPAEAVKQISRGDLTTLCMMQPASWEEPTHLRLDLATCPNCHDVNLLTITLVSFTNQPDVQLTQDLTISPQEAQLIRDLQSGWKPSD